MPTAYIGVFCLRCRKFIEISRHSVERPEVNAVEMWDDCLEIPCPFCHRSSAYNKTDVAQALSPDGTGPRYPWRR